MVDENAYLIDRWKTEEGQAYYEEIQKEFYDHELLTQLASKYFGFIDEYIDLRGIDLHGKDLSHAVLAYCDLSCADFSYIVASQATFSYSDIFNANFEHARLKWCTIDNINAKSTTFKESFLSHANFNKSELTKCNFSLANIANTNMALCNFEGCTLKKIELDDVSLNSSKIPKSQECWIKANEGKYNDNLKRIEWI